MKKRLLALVLSMFFIVAQSMAQQKTVTGRVTSADDEESLPGVSVLVKGSKTGTSTDGNGRFSVRAEKGQILVFSFVGTVTQEIRVTDNNTINVKLESGNKTLNEVVVVGYGTQKKAHLTGAVSSVNVEEVMGSRPIPDVGRGLQGTMPGLSIVVPSGEVGSDPILKIRGQVGSVYGNNTPLILLDNVEIPSLQMVNPSDIESVSVLKDAASSSIYGAKAAWGVVLITTKKGSKNAKPTVNYSTNLVWQSPFKEIEVAGIDGLEYTLEAHENMKAAGPAGGFWRIDRTSFGKIKDWQTQYAGVVGNSDPVVYGRDWYWDGTQKFGYRIYDPVDAMIKDHGFSNIHNLSLSGSNNNITYNFSLGYLGQEGMMKPAKHDDYNRFTPALNLSAKVSDFLTVRGSARYSENKKRYPNSTSTSGFGADPWLYLYRWSRLFPVGVQENGKDIIDPAYSARTANDAINSRKYMNLNLGSTLNFTKNWDLQADYTYSTENRLFTSSVPVLSAKTHWYGVEALRDESGQPVYVDENGNVTDTGGMLAYQFPMTDYVLPANSYFNQESYLDQRHTLNAYSTYRLNLQNKHEFKFMLGTNIVGYRFNSHSSKRTGLLNNDNPQFKFTTGTDQVGGDANWESQAGFFGRVNYAFRDKYLLETNLRYDGTSKFPTHLQWNWYPSFSAGWVITNEKLMEPLRQVLSFAKLRGSWGSIGDQQVDNGLYKEIMESQGKSSWLNGNGEQFFYIGQPRPLSESITWQDIEHLNLGADMRFFKNKLGVTFEWFQRETKNMIVPGDALPPTYGYATPPMGNYGNLRTRGWEITADYSHRFDNGLRVTINANLADASTFVTKGPDFRTPWENRSLSSAFATGGRYGDVYGFVTDRLFQKDDFVYDGNGNILQTTIIRDGTAKRTNMLAGDNPVYQVFFEDGNQVLLVSPGDVKFVDVNGDGYIDQGKNTFGEPGDKVVIGNTTPRYQYGARLGAEFKGFDFSVFMQGVGKRSIWGSGQLAIPGYYAKEGAMPQAIAEDFWKEDRTDAFYPRAWNLNGENEGFVMRKQSRYMLDMSYLRIKNITFGYSFPKSLLTRLRMANARIYVSLENMFTFDNLRGLPIDPEAISGVSSLRSGDTYNLGRTGTSNPAFKSASMGVQIGF